MIPLPYTARRLGVVPQNIKENTPLRSRSCPESSIAWLPRIVGTEVPLGSHRRVQLKRLLHHLNHVFLVRIDQHLVLHRVVVIQHEKQFAVAGRDLKWPAEMEVVFDVLRQVSCGYDERAVGSTVEDKHGATMYHVIYSSAYSDHLEVLGCDAPMRGARSMSCKTIRLGARGNQQLCMHYKRTIGL